MKNKFEQNVIKELNIFRSNPKSIQHQCELIHKGLSRLRANDPFLKEIESFLKELETIKPLPELKYNEVLSESAKKELPNFRGRDNYRKYKTGKDMKGIVPDVYLEAYPALVADDGADEPINVLTKVLLNKLDTLKEGRSILCDKKYTQVGIAQEEFQEENMVILIFATRYIDDKPIKSTKSDFLMNIQYHETKDIKKPKLQAKVHHRIRGEIFGGENFVKTKYQKAIYSQGPNRPKLEQKPDLNEYKPSLRGNKSVKVMNQYSSRTAAPSKPKGRIQNISTVKKEKIQETSTKRRNEGISTKTETKIEKTTTKSNITTNTNTRGKTKETYSTSTNKITNARGKPKEVYNTSTTTNINKSTGRRASDGLNKNEINKKSETMYKTKTATIFKRDRGNNNTNKNEEKGNENKETFSQTKYFRRFRRRENIDSTPIKTDNKTENKDITITITKVEETDNNNKDNKVFSTEAKTNKRFRKKNNDIVNKTETKVIEVSLTKVEEIGNDKGETFTETKITKKIKGGDDESEKKTETKTEIETETKVEEKVEAEPISAGSSIRRKYAKKKRY